MLTGIFGFLRSSEFTLLQHSEYDPDLNNIAKPTMVHMKIKELKTDPFRKGATICLGKTDTEFCPILALSPYLTLRGSHPGSLFIMQDLTYNLARFKFTDKLQEILKEAGIDNSKYASHSYWSDATTTAAEVNIPDVGRWKSEAYQIYVKLAPETLAKVST